MIDLQSTALIAGVNGLIGLLFYFGSRRPTEKVDKLETRVKELENNRIARIEKDLAKDRDHNAEMFEKSALARKSIYEEIGWIKTHFVHAKTCQDAHKSLKEAIDRFLSATMDLARHDERLDVLTKSLELFHEQLMAVKQDFDRFYGQKGGK